MSIDFLYSRVGHLVRRLQQISIGVFLDAVGPDAITPVQFAALTAISEHPLLDIQRLANLVAVDRATLGQVIDRLVKSQHVVRAENVLDKRSRVVKALPAGEELLREMRTNLAGADARLLQPLSDVEQKIFTIYLRQLVHTGNDFSRAPLVAEENDDRELSLYSRPGYLVRRLQQICEGIFAAEMGGTGLTAGQYAALAATAGMTGGDNTWLANAIGLDRVTTGEIVQRLDARGLIEVRKNPADKRSKSLHITAAGKSLLQEIEPRIQRADHRILETFSAPDREEFVRLLRKLVENNNEVSRAPLRNSSQKRPRRKRTEVA